jgi:uroporphyrinogen III methyltransferase/synthase
VAEAYETIVPEQSRARLEQILGDRHQRPTIITFTSSSTARNFVALLGSDDPTKALHGIRIASIGPVTSATLQELGLGVDIEAAEFTIPGLLKAVVEGG